MIDILKHRNGRSNFECPEQNSFVIHLRLGDKLEKAYFALLKRTDHDKQRAYRQFLQYGWEDRLSGDKPSHIKGVPELLSDVQSVDARKVYIVSGTHYKFANKLGHMSYVYLMCLKRTLEAEGLIVNLRVGGNPGECFTYDILKTMFYHSLCVTNLLDRL